MKVFLLLCILAVVPYISCSPLFGIDVSAYQGNVNWQEVASSNVTFAMAKATEGTSYVDDKFSANWAGMKKNRLYRTAYHFAHPNEDANAQAEHFVSTVKNAGGYYDDTTLQLVLDLETSDGMSSSSVWSWVQTFVSKMKYLTGKPPMIYTGYYFWQDNVGNPNNNLDCPLWIAAYSSSPLVPNAWSSVGWAFWQFSDNGEKIPGGTPGPIPGISGNVDTDQFKNSGAYPNIKYLCYEN